MDGIISDVWERYTIRSKDIIIKKRKKPFKKIFPSVFVSGPINVGTKSPNTKTVPKDITNNE